MKTLSSCFALSLLLAASCGEQEFFVTIQANAIQVETPPKFRKIVVDLVPLTPGTPASQVEIVADVDNNGQDITLPTTYALAFPKDLEGKQYKLVQRGFVADVPDVEIFSAETIITVGGNNTEQAGFHLGSALPLSCQNGVVEAGEFCFAAIGTQALPGTPKQVEHFPIQIDIPNRQEFWTITETKNLVRFLTDGANFFPGQAEAPFAFSANHLLFGDFLANPPLESLVFNENDASFLVIEPAFVGKRTPVSVPEIARAAVALDADEKGLTDLATLGRDLVYLFLPDVQNGLVAAAPPARLSLQTVGCEGKALLSLENPSTRHQDIVVTCKISGQGPAIAEVFFGNGDGTFLNGQQKTLAAGVPNVVVSMDSSPNDHKNVVVVLEDGSNTNVQLLRRDINGFLAPLSVQVLPFRATAVETGDLNGDGRDELLIGAEDGQLFVFVLGNDDNLHPVLFGFLQNTIRTITVLGDANGDAISEVVVGRNPNELVLFSSVP